MNQDQQVAQQPTAPISYPVKTIRALIDATQVGLISATAGKGGQKIDCVASLTFGVSNADPAVVQEFLYAIKGCLGQFPEETPVYDFRCDTQASAALGNSISAAAKEHYTANLPKVKTKIETKVKASVKAKGEIEPKEAEKSAPEVAKVAEKG